MDKDKLIRDSAELMSAVRNISLDEAEQSIRSTIASFKYPDHGKSTKKYGVEILFISNDSNFYIVTGEQLMKMFDEYMNDFEPWFHVGKVMISKNNDKGKKWVKQIIVEEKE